MRVNAEIKVQTDRRIRQAARKLFIQKGFSATTTRDIARASDIAVGTLFNYFPTKEHLGMALVVEALAFGEQDFLERRRGNESLAEDLFAFIMSGLRRMEDDRPYAAEVLETFLNPLSHSGRSVEAEEFRLCQMMELKKIFAFHEVDEPSPTLMHLYWSIYLAIVRLWSGDASEHLTETLALTDQATRLFADAVRAHSKVQETVP